MFVKLRYSLRYSCEGIPIETFLLLEYFYQGIHIRYS